MLASMRIPDVMMRWYDESSLLIGTIIQCHLDIGDSSFRGNLTEELSSLSQQISGKY